MRFRSIIFILWEFFLLKFYAGGIFKVSQMATILVCHLMFIQMFLFIFDALLMCYQLFGVAIFFDF
jgi:hypothetical protein